MQEKRVRIVDIAEELGLSTATVSNVIHGKTKKISDETVKRVQELLEKKQYIPSMAGILLAQNDSRMIGVVVNDHEKYEGHVLEDAYIASALNELAREIEGAGYFMMVKVTKAWNEIARFASMWNLEGMIVIGFCGQDYRKLKDATHVPFVVYDGFFTEPARMCNITIDNRDGGRKIGNHFRELGHERALCISDNHICMDLERYQGFQEGMDGKTADFLEIPMQKQERQKFYEERLELLRSYTAIFAVSDEYALELVQFLREKGLSVPEDISVAGFDDNPLCEKLYPTLTTIRQDRTQRAKLALKLLREQKEGAEDYEEVVLPVTLVVRQSTSPIRREGSSC